MGEDKKARPASAPKEEEEDKGKAEETNEPREMKEKKPELGTQQTGFVWTSEAVRDLELFLKDLLGQNLADKYLTYKKDEAEGRRRYFETVSRHNRNMVYVLIAFMVGIVAFMSLLTYYGHVSGDALLFLVGTITGYIILFIQRLVFPTKETPPAEEEQA